MQWWCIPTGLSIFLMHSSQNWPHERNGSSEVLPPLAPYHPQYKCTFPSYVKTKHSLKEKHVLKLRICFLNNSTIHFPSIACVSLWPCSIFVGPALNYAFTARYAHSILSLGPKCGSYMTRLRQETTYWT